MIERSAEAIASTISDRLRLRRSETGRSLQQIADAAGVTKAHVWDLERGKTANPGLKTIVGIARALGCSVEWLMGLTEDLPPMSPEALRIALEVDAMLMRVQSAPLLAEIETLRRERDEARADAERLARLAMGEGA